MTVHKNHKKKDNTKAIYILIIKIKPVLNLKKVTTA